ncbi:MAG: polysaccharide deacetylase family protein [Vicinamibacterales bacterium]
MATPALMYHELKRPGRPLADADPGYVRYAIAQSRFEEHLARIAAAGRRGVSLGQACKTGFGASGQVIITFDDGCQSDWVVGAPRLAEHGFGATFYVVSRWIGRRAGFLRGAELRALSEAGFEIGSHSATHAFLSDLDDAALRRELADSRREIEDILGRPVTHLSCPGGRAGRRVADAAREAGYESLATSRIGVNGRATDPYALSRCPLRRDTPHGTFDAFCRGERLAALQVREAALAAAKALLGNRLYTSLRSVALRRAESG